MMKKWFYLVMLVSLLLTACAGQPATAAPAAPAAPASPTTAAPVEKPSEPASPTAAPIVIKENGSGISSTTITFSMWGAPEELTVWKQIVADFEEVNPGIKVNVEVSDWDSYWDKLKTQLAAGTAPDVFAMDAPLFLDYQSRDVLLNLQPYLDKNPDMLKDVYPQTLAAYKTADGYYGLPRDFQTIVLFCNCSAD